MQRSEQLNELFAALAKAQGAYQAATKDSENPHFRSRYADLASGWNAVRAALSANGLSVIQDLTTDEQGVRVETILGHSSGQFISGDLFVPAARMDAQGIGSASTYGRRYALYAIAGIAPEDDDGNAAVGQAPQAPAQPAPKQPPAPKPTGPTQAQREEYAAAFKELGMTPQQMADCIKRVVACAPAALDVAGADVLLAYLRGELAGRKAEAGS